MRGNPGLEPLKSSLLRDRIGGGYRSSTPGGVINPIPRWIRGGSNHQVSSRLSPWGAPPWISSPPRPKAKPSPNPFPQQREGERNRQALLLPVPVDGSRDTRVRETHDRSEGKEVSISPRSWRMVHLDHMLIQSSLRWPFGFVLLLQSPNSKLVKPLGKSDNLDRLGLALSES